MILVAHQGKDANKKVRGHSGFMGNADVVLHVEANKVAGAIKVTVEKMRDGRDGFSIFFRVAPAGAGGVPVPEKITEAEYKALTGHTGAGPDDAQWKFAFRRNTLIDRGVVSFEKGLSEKAFAEILVGERPDDDNPDALATWKTAVEQERKSLQNAHGKKGYKGILCDQRVPTGSDQMEWRWCFLGTKAANTSMTAPRSAADLAALFPGAADLQLGGSAG